jgi:CYTH domain-containing protein
MAVHEEIERKWLLTNVPQNIIADEIILIEQWYRPSEKGVIRYRRSVGSNNPPTFEKIIKTNIAIGINSEESIPISGDKFAREIEPTMKYIRKTRRVYHYNGTKFELDDFQTLKLVVLEAEGPTQEFLSKEIEFPHFIQPLIIKEVTGDNAFSNFSLARPQY